MHDERHVDRAAEKLNLTPSAVSHGLGRLRRLLPEWGRYRSEDTRRQKASQISIAHASAINT
ncbi:hypothetical protein MES4922_110292 [Mesorhizobium ventifaucium]|uniref:HTH lysR-type domain-containing protein n=1 Tax=Mesorhizobium ventifaucium TaxID=666020 RepID=A0ABM9DEC1_9HYPH|nr:hypothetical protein MES4922_110292 [Mesorhizobium ventifaucium]